MKRNRLTASVLILSSFLLLLQACAPAGQPQKKQPLQVVEAVTIGEPQKKLLNVTGTIYTTSDLNIFFLVEGTIEAGELALKPGTRFKKGQLLIAVNNSNAYKLLRQQQKQLVNSIQSLLPEIEKRFPSQLEKWRRFSQAIGPTQLLPAFPELSSRDETLFLLTTTVRDDYEAAQRSEAVMKQYFYVAPFDGVVVETFLSPGKTAQKYTPVAAIARTAHYGVTIRVKENELFVANDTRSFLVQNDRGELIGNGNLNMSKRSSDPLLFSSEFKAVPGKRLQSGQQVKVVADPAYAPAFSVIPQSALHTNNVLTVVNGKAQKKQVDIRQVAEDSVYVSALPKGMQLVLSYDEKLSEKPVRVK